MQAAVAVLGLLRKKGRKQKQPNQLLCKVPQEGPSSTACSTRSAMKPNSRSAPQQYGQGDSGSCACHNIEHAPAAQQWHAHQQGTDGLSPAPPAAGTPRWPAGGSHGRPASGGRGHALANKQQPGLPCAGCARLGRDAPAAWGGGGTVAAAAAAAAEAGHAPAAAGSGAAGAGHLWGWLRQGSAKTNLGGLLFASAAGPPAQFLCCCYCCCRASGSAPAPGAGGAGGAGIKSGPSASARC
eukprot:1137320-Pelagomonas_calceolata.AAC.1